MNIDEQKKQHLAYLRQKNFPIHIDKAGFSQKELQILKDYGYWLEAMYLGELKPLREEHQHFLDAVKGKTETTTIHEKTWAKYLQQLAMQEGTATIRMSKAEVAALTGAKLAAKTQPKPQVPTHSSVLSPAATLIRDYESAIARLVLHCITELPFSFGITKLVGVLKGAKSSYIVQHKLNKLATYATLTGFTKDQLSNIVEIIISYGLIEVEYMKSRDFTYPVLIISDEGKAFLNKEIEYDLVLLDSIIDKSIIELTSTEKALFDELKTLRHELAHEQDLPPFAVCADQSLRRICRKMPKTTQDLLTIKGIGEKFVEKYGDDFLKALKAV